jgi:hypothetical protein
MSRSSSSRLGGEVRPLSGWLMALLYALECQPLRYLVVRSEAVGTAITKAQVPPTVCCLPRTPRALYGPSRQEPAPLRGGNEPAMPESGG